MSQDTLLEATETQTALPEETPQGPSVIPMSEFLADFGDGLLEAVTRQNPPIYDGVADTRRQAVLDGLLREPFAPQADAVQALARLLLDAGERGAILAGEMGTGKTLMAIALASVLHAEGYPRALVIAPPHLVYKWRREVLETVPNARVWVLNGPDTLRKLLALRALLQEGRAVERPEFFILGRVRMRMGFHWRPAVAVRKQHTRRIEDGRDASAFPLLTQEVAACPRCAAIVTDADGEPVAVGGFPQVRRERCRRCGEALWQLIRPRGPAKDRRQLVKDALCQFPTIGPKTAERLLGQFGHTALGGMLEDNVYELLNLMDEDGELVFSDRQAQRMERALSGMEIAFGQGGYQPSEYVKRYLPDGYFSLLLADEAHELKDGSSAQGQALGVLANKVRKVVLLTGTLMGGYGDDLFHLLWRIMPARMIEDGYRYNAQGSLSPAAMAFMREHGVLKDIFKEVDAGAHRTARGKRVTVRTAKAPGFGPKGIAHHLLPYTAFVKLKDLGEGVLPPYEEHFTEVPMTEEQAERYGKLSGALTAELKEALRKGDNSLLGVVLNALLAWPDCCFRQEVVKHPHSRDLLAYVPAVFGEGEAGPKEEAAIALCKEERAAGRRVLLYSIYTGTRDTTARLKALLEREGIKAAVLRSSVDTARREDWIGEQVDRGCEVLITHPDLVRTGLDLLEFPTVCFLQTGYSVYTLQQAARRSWRIGQREPVDVHFLGYAETAQMACLALMAKKIAVAQSTSGEMPESGLDILNQDGDSVEVALAKRLLG